jgi:hypothetical protein
MFWIDTDASNKWNLSEMIISTRPRICCTAKLSLRRSENKIVRARNRVSKKLPNLLGPE